MRYNPLSCVQRIQPHSVGKRQVRTKVNPIFWLLPIAGILICAFSSVPAEAAIEYSVTDLGTLDGSFSEGQGINSSGQVTGTADAGTFLWSPTTPNGSSGAMYDLGTLPGGTGSSSGYAINASGQITGYSSSATSNEHAMLWSPTSPNGSSGTMSDLGTLSGTDLSLGYGINSRGQVAGQSFTSTGRINARPFLWNPAAPNGSSGTIYDLGTLGGTNGAADAINTYGEVVGYSYNAFGVPRAFLWSPTTPNGTSGTMQDLGTLGGFYGGTAYGINSSGQVTGTADAGAEDYHAFLWSPTTPNGTTGTMQDLGTLGGVKSYGFSINTTGEVVGISNYTTATNDYHAILWTSNTGLVDLNTLINPLSGWELDYANAINDAGQITGYGVIGGNAHSFLLTPVPEPSAFLLTASGLVWLIFVTRSVN